MTIHPDWRQVDPDPPAWETVSLTLEQWAQLTNTMYYKTVPWMEARWRGVQVIKPPTDLWSVAEIIHETRPDVIVETGTFYGGSALFYADMCELEGHGVVVSIDVEPMEGRPEHPRLRYVWASSVALGIVEQVRAVVDEWREDRESRALSEFGDRWMVMLDSDHHVEHVNHELEVWAPMVGEGCYLIVEDTNIHLLGDRDDAPGPHFAVERFLGKHPEWQRDLSRQRYLITFHPGGYLFRP